MPTGRKNRKQYVEPYAEFVGEEMKPFVALLPKEEKTIQNSSPSLQQKDATTTPSTRKKPFWKRVAALFS